MKVLQSFVVLALCPFTTGADALGIDYAQMNDIYLRSQETHTSLEKTIDIAKSMIQSMETKLSEAHNYIGRLEDKLNVCGQKNMLTDQLEKKLTPLDDRSKEYIMKIVGESLFKSERDQRLQFENVTRRLERMENKLSNNDVLEATLHTAESAFSTIETELEKNMKVLENKPVLINQKSSGDNIAEKASASDVQNKTITKSRYDNDVIDEQWHDRKDTEINQVYSQQVNDVDRGIFRGFRAAADDRVAFRVSGISRVDGHYSGERIVFSSVDYNEGSGYDVTSGIFICPTTGTYFFTATLGSYGSVYIDAFLKIDGVVKIKLYAGYHLHGDNMVGQSVWMEVSKGDYLGVWESMSGFIIWADIASS
ncbi:hypothetical protein ACJMK2_022575 [Sinanodonta woodiana]|uniref:C1q domain-containing protein n=1 Tax=Sinanodonta woodiana TaxID=1069815 RepID=A0ABD3TJH2_SINWO